MLKMIKTLKEGIFSVPSYLSKGCVKVRKTFRVELKVIGEQSVVLEHIEQNLSRKAYEQIRKIVQMDV